MRETREIAQVSHDIPLTEIRCSAFCVRRSAFCVLHTAFVNLPQPQIQYVTIKISISRLGTYTQSNFIYSSNSNAPSKQKKLIHCSHNFTYHLQNLPNTVRIKVSLSICCNPLLS